MERVLYIHHGNTSDVEPVDDVLGWHTDSTYEQSSFLLNNHVDEFAQLALSVVVL